MPSRRAVPAVVLLVTPAGVAALELKAPVAELASPTLVSGAAVARVTVAPVPAAPVARLVWLDPAGVARGSEAVAQTEVARMLRAMGVVATWRHGEPAELARPGELRVIFLRGGRMGGLR